MSHTVIDCMLIDVDQHVRVDSTVHNRNTHVCSEVCAMGHCLLQLLLYIIYSMHYFCLFVHYSSIFTEQIVTGNELFSGIS